MTADAPAPPPIDLARMRAAIARVRAVVAGQSDHATRIRAAADSLGELFDVAGQAARIALVEAVASHKELGWPPSFVQLAGVSDLEKPFNRLLGWWARAGDHGAGYAFVRELARRFELPAMIADLEANAPVVVRVEDAFDEDIGKEPDLVVLTPRAALMLENKVHAGESGDQYAPYLAQFALERGDRDWSAVLAARDARERPPGWTHAVSHADLAGIFRTIAADETVRFWTRIAATVTAVAFDDDAGVGGALAQAEALLQRTKVGRIGPNATREMRRLAVLAPPTLTGGR